MSSKVNPASDQHSHGMNRQQSSASPSRLHRGATIQFGSMIRGVPNSTVQLEKERDHRIGGTLQEQLSLEASSQLTDNASTHISSLDGKPPSIGGKSIASAVTFALDEKESLRPDDSASIAAAVEDEDNHGAAARTADSSNGSNEDVRAFREQLNEISAIDPLRRATITGISQNGTPGQGVLYVPPVDDHTAGLPQDAHEAPPDFKLLEALENPRDRIWVLKLEQDVIDFVKDTKESSLILPQCNSFYRMLAHKIADYYMLGHSVDDSNSAVRLFRTASCHIVRPLTGVVTPSTAASTPPPSVQMKILRRAIDNSGPAIANGSNMPSKSTSETGDSEDDPRKPATREEREARYEAARLRIMGAAKPAEGDLPKESDQSRSSSVSRKTRKARKDDADDDFGARSAYNSYVTHAQPTAYAIPQQFPAPPPQPYPAQQYTQTPGLPQYGAQLNNGQYWYQGPQEGDWSTWVQPQPQPNTYDLAREFDRSMSFQSSPPTTYSAPHSPFTPSYQASLGQSQGWPPPQAPSHNERPASASQAPMYAYGQLPSEAMGRPPNALEHPLPGSYKSRHFNPQSQTFVPGHGPLFRPFMPQRAMSGPSVGASMQPGASDLQRQMSTQSQGSHLNSPQHSTMNRLPPQILTHPLPQPVFPLQAPPSIALPPKPKLSQQILQNGLVHAAQKPTSRDGSTIAKWGTPASLPPKPPSFEPQESKVLQTPKPIAASLGSLNFGSMPATDNA